MLVTRSTVRLARLFDFMIYPVYKLAHFCEHISYHRDRAIRFFKLEKTSDSIERRLLAFLEDQSAARVSLKEKKNAQNISFMNDLAENTYS